MVSQGYTTSKFVASSHLCDKRETIEAIDGLDNHFESYYCNDETNGADREMNEICDFLRVVILQSCPGCMDFGCLNSPGSSNSRTEIIKYLMHI